MADYSLGFDVYGKSDYETVEWLFGKKESSDDKLVFLAYDANLWPLPIFSTWKDEKWKQKQINHALAFTHDFEGEVWLDDVMVKAQKGREDV